MKHFCPETGRFEDPPARPNWVSSQTASARHYLPPVSLADDPDAAFAELNRIVAAWPRTTLVEQTDSYIHAECRSRLFGFVDDVELLLVREKSLIDFCSAARQGWSDFGVNRRRMDEIRAVFELQ